MFDGTFGRRTLRNAPARTRRAEAAPPEGAATFGDRAGHAHAFAGRFVDGGVPVAAVQVLPDDDAAAADAAADAADAAADDDDDAAAAVMAVEVVDDALGGDQRV